MIGLARGRIVRHEISIELNCGIEMDCLDLGRALAK